MISNFVHTYDCPHPTSPRFLKKTLSLSPLAAHVRNLDLQSGARTPPRVPGTRRRYPGKGAYPPGELQRPGVRPGRGRRPHGGSELLNTRGTISRLAAFLLAFFFCPRKVFRKRRWASKGTIQRLNSITKRVVCGRNKHPPLTVSPMPACRYAIITPALTSNARNVTRHDTRRGRRRNTTNQAAWG